MSQHPCNFRCHRNWHHSDAGVPAYHLHHQYHPGLCAQWGSGWRPLPPHGLPPQHQESLPDASSAWRPKRSVPYASGDEQPCNVQTPDCGLRDSRPYPLLSPGERSGVRWPLCPAQQLGSSVEPATHSSQRPASYFSRWGRHSSYGSSGSNRTGMQQLQNSRPTCRLVGPGRRNSGSEAARLECEESAPSPSLTKRPPAVLRLLCPSACAGRLLGKVQWQSFSSPPPFPLHRHSHQSALRSGLSVHLLA